MLRTYEFALVFRPSLSDEAVARIVDEVRDAITASGAEITKQESWGKRKLAYPIDKEKEGRYMFLYIRAEQGIPPFADIERRLNQSEDVLRYLVVRTDQDIKRALRRGTKPIPAAVAVGLAPETRTSSARKD